MRLILPIIGILIAVSLGSPASRLFDLCVGAAIGFLVAELATIRSGVAALCQEIERLKQEFRRRQEAPTTSAPSGETKDALDSATSDAPQDRTTAPTGTSWICAQCGEQLEAQFTRCWRCGAMSASKVTEYPEHQPAHSAPNAPSNRPWQDIEPATREPAPRPSVPHPPASPILGSNTQEPALIGAIRIFFTGGNTLVRVGVIVLFFGVAFLLRYMAEHSHISIEVRLTGVALASIALVILGWRLRKTRGGYALALQGGGVGILYLVVFAALRLYSILPAALAFPLLALIALLSAILAVLQNSMSFALLGVSGGFLAPVLASTDEGSHIVLFSYYAVLNLGILAIAWFKAWRPLNLVGFVFTFAIGTAWGVLKYRPEDFATTEPFLILFFLFYLSIAILFTLRQPTKTFGFIDGTLIFGTPIIGFSLQSAMLQDRLMALAYSAVALSALYLSVAYLLKRRPSDPQKLLFESFLALGVAFLTLAVPLALDARWNAATWALEGTALVWIGCRQNRLMPRLFGALLNVAAGFIVFNEFDTAAGLLPLGGYFALLVQSAAAVFSARTLNAHRDAVKELELLIAQALYCWGVGFWLMGGVSEIRRYLPAHVVQASLILVTVTAFGSCEIYRRTDLAAARIAALLQLPTLLGFAAFAAAHDSHPAVHGGWWAWPAAFAGLYWVMFHLEGKSRASLANGLNVGATWLVAALLSWELAWQMSLRVAGDTWKAVAWIILPAALLWWLPRLVTRIKWPFAKNREAYLFIAGVGVALYLSLWSLIANVTSTGDTAPLPYLPLLNALDLAQAAVLLTLLRYWRFLRSVSSPGFVRMDKRIPLVTLVALCFVALNSMLLRTLHQWFGVGMGLEQLMESTLVQTSLSLFWTVLALTAMLTAARRRERVVWLVGATLLGVVIAKLFLIDLSRIGSVERIISFVGVGLLMLIVGYFSPLPPAREPKS